VPSWTEAVDVELPTVRVVRRGGRRWGLVDLSPDEMDALMRGDPAPAAAVVADLLRRLGVPRGARAALVLPSSAALEQTVRLPPRIPPRELRAAMLDAARRQFGPGHDALHIATRYLGEGRAYLFGIRRDQVAARVALARAAGLRPVRAAVQSACWAAALGIRDGFVAALSRGWTLTLVAYAGSAPADAFAAAIRPGHAVEDAAEALQMLCDPERLAYHGLSASGALWALGEAARWPGLAEVVRGAAPGLSVVVPEPLPKGADAAEYAAAWALSSS